MPKHLTNTYCSSTPASDGKRIVVWHSSAGLYCYDLSGKQLWSRDLGEFEHDYGPGSSPVIYQDRVVLHCGPGEREFLAAIDLENGKTLWETEEPQDQERAGTLALGSWSTPVIAKVGGKDQVICAMPTRVNGYDLQTGEILWWCGGLSGTAAGTSFDVVSSSPLIANDLCFAMADLRGPSIGFKLGGQGDITQSNGLWQIDKRNPYSVGTGVFLGKYIYRPNSKPGAVECLEAETGKSVWKNRAAGRDHWGSMVLAGGNLYAINQRGTTVVFKPNPKEFEEVGRNALGESTNATPAFSDGQIFIRTDEHLFCIGK
jgi:outer membrane protein assembly factor BamB